MNESQRPLSDLRPDAPAEERQRLEAALRKARQEYRQSQTLLATHFASRALALHPLQESDDYRESLREALVSLPRERFPERPDSARLLAGEPIQALWRGHTHPDPYLGGYVNGSIHVTPDPQVVESYLGEANGTIASPLPEGFSFLTRLSPSESLRYYGNFGWERGQRPRALEEILPEARAQDAKIKAETAASPWGAGGYDILTRDLYETLGSPEATPISGRFVVDARREDLDPRSGRMEPRRGNHLRVYSIPDTPEWQALMGRMAQVSQRLLALDTLTLRRDTTQKVLEFLSRQAAEHARGEVVEDVPAPSAERGSPPSPLSPEQQERQGQLQAERQAWSSWFQSGDYLQVTAALKADLSSTEEALERARQAPFAPSSEQDVSRTRERMGEGTAVGAYFTPKQKEEAGQEFHRQLLESVMARVEAMGQVALERQARPRISYGTASPIPAAEVRATVLASPPNTSPAPVGEPALPSLQERLLRLVEGSKQAAPETASRVPLPSPPPGRRVGR